MLDFHDSRGRGKAFPQEFMDFQVLSIWECFTLKSQRRDNLLVKAKRILHLQIEIVVGSLGIVVQMQNPYGYFCQNRILQIYLKKNLIA